MTRNRFARIPHRPILEILERRDLPSFVAPVVYSAGSLPGSMISEDFNGDGQNDLAIANQVNPGRVSMLMNDGGGIFQAAKSFPTGGNGTKSTVAAADFNGDGRLDLVVSNRDSGTVSILRGSGTGLFRRPVTYAAGPDPTDVSVGDFNADSIPDLAVSNFKYNNGVAVSTLLGKGDGTFYPAQGYTVGAHRALAVAAGDLNGDGRDDVVSVGHNETHIGNGNEPTLGKVCVFLSQSDGTLQLTKIYARESPGDVQIADLNSDGDRELVVVHTYEETDYKTQIIDVFLGNGNGSFQNAHSYSVGPNPTSLAIADLNADRALDVAVSSSDKCCPWTSADDRVSVLIGNGDGTLKPAVPYAAGAKLASIVVRDFTGDGLADLAVANKVSGNGAVAVLFGIGDGVFPSVPTYDAGPFPSSGAATDLNSDGDLDLIVGSPEWHTPEPINVLLGGAGHGFQSKASYYAGQRPGTVGTADFDADGIIDVAVASPSGYVSFLSGMGDGTLEEGPPAYPGGIDPYGVVTSDFNGDGVLDLATAETWWVCSGNCPPRDTVSVLLGTGNGAFAPPVTYHTGIASQGLAVGDFNGDDISDLVTGFVIMLGHGDGTFQTAVLHGGSGLAVAVGDLDADGLLDVVTTRLGNYVKVSRGNGDGTFKPAASYTVVGVPANVTIGDFDGDGIPDLATANEGGETLGVLLGNGNGTFQTTAYYYIGAGSFPTDVDAGDFNGDGRADLAVALFGGQAMAVFVADEDGGFGNPAFYPVTIFPAGAIASDLNADGHLDLAVASGHAMTNGSFPNVNILWGKTDGTFELAEHYLAGPDSVNVVAGDFDLDGDLDLVVPNLGYKAGDPGTVTVLRGTTNGFDSIRAYMAGPNHYEAVMAIADLNHDGRPDVVVANSFQFGVDSVSVLLNIGNGHLSERTAYTVDGDTYAVAVADLNGDSHSDIVATNSATGTVSILLGIGDGTFQVAVNFAAGSMAHGLAVGDFNSDGDLDLAVSNHLNAGTLSILQGRGDGTFFPPATYAVGALPGAVVAADFNLDGITDVAVANYGSGTLSVLLGMGDGTFGFAANHIVGPGPSALVVADFDGDGWLDISVTIVDAVAILRNAADWSPLPNPPRRPINFSRPAVEPKSEDKIQMGSDASQPDAYEPSEMVPDSDDTARAESTKPTVKRAVLNHRSELEPPTTADMTIIQRLSI